VGAILIGGYPAVRTAKSIPMVAKPHPLSNIWALIFHGFVVRVASFETIINPSDTKKALKTQQIRTPGKISVAYAGRQKKSASRNVFWNASSTADHLDHRETESLSGKKSDPFGKARVPTRTGASPNSRPAFQIVCCSEGAATV